MQTEKNIWLRVLSMILTLALLISCVPNQVYALAGEALAELLEQEETAETIETPNETKRGVYEVTERREANVKHFALEDGTYTAVMYGSAVHTQDAEGNWQDIDNRLSASGSEFSTSNARIKFAKKITGNENLFTLHDGNRKITMSLNNAIKKTVGAVTNHTTEFDSEATQLQKLMTLDNLSSEILYADILDGVDLQYVVESLNVKENIIVKERKDSYQYTFTIALNNLEAEMVDDGSVRIYDPSTKETVYNIPAGFMYDANGEYSAAVVYALTNGGNGKYSLTVTADATWINAEERAFPVVIDPTIWIKNKVSEYDATYITLSNVNTNYSNLGYFEAGTKSIAFWRLHTLPTLPAGCYIAGATFVANKYSTSNSENYDLNLGVYKVIRNWSLDTFNYLEYANQKIGECVEYPTDAIAGTNQDPQYIWDITQIVREWYNDPASNFGIAIRNTSTSTSNYNYKFAFSGAAMPIQITYKPITGLEDYWSYATQTADRAGTGYVNKATGELTFGINTISTYDALFGQTVSLVYNQTYAGKYVNSSVANIPLIKPTAGYGFKLTVNEFLMPKTYINTTGDSITYYIWTDADGTEHDFYQDPNNLSTYIDSDGLLLTLTVENGVYTIEDTHHNVRIFKQTSSDRTQILNGAILESITDKNGNMLKYLFNNSGQIEMIQVIPNGGVAINYIEFLYNTYGLVKEIHNYSDSSAPKVKLYYSSSTNGGTNVSLNNGGYLHTVEFIVEDQVIASTLYTYDEHGRLYWAYDRISKYSLTYLYDGNRIKYIAEDAGDYATMGQTISLAYGTGYTELRSSGSDDQYYTDDDIISVCNFDRCGRVTSTYSTDLNRTRIYGASSGEYESQENIKNNFKSTVTVGGTASNYIVNGGFEYVTNNNAQSWNKSGNISFTATGYASKEHDNHCAQVALAKNNNSALAQRVFLPTGSYTLSLDCNSVDAANVNVMLVATSVDNPAHSFSLQIPTDEHDVAEHWAIYALSFEVQDYNSTGGEVFDISILVNCDAYAVGQNGSLFIDNIMLEENIGHSGYSMVEFGNFEDYAIAWNDIAKQIYSDYWLTPFHVVYEDPLLGNVLKVDPSTVSTAVAAVQTIYVGDNNLEGSAAKTFVVSGMAKGTQQYASGDFRLQIHVWYTDNTTENFDVIFQDDCNTWQFAAKSFSTQEKAISLINLSIIYNNPGVAYFDNIYVTQVVDESVVTNEYDGEGRLRVRKNGFFQEYYEYDSNGNVKRVANNQGEIHDFTYTEKNNPETETYYHFWTQDGSRNYPYTEENPDDFFQVFIQTRTECTYNPYGQMVSSVTYNAETLEEATERVTASYVYDTTDDSRFFGALLEETDSLGNTTKYFYDADRGYLLATVNTATMTGTCYTYDAIGRVTSVMPATYSETAGYTPVHAEQEVQYTYYPTDQLQSIITKSTTYTFTYDVFGKDSSILIGSHEIINYEYNSKNGKLKQINYGNNTSVKYYYDELENFSKVCYVKNDVETTAYEYQYTAYGQLARFDNRLSGKSIVYRYDVNNRIISFVEFDTEDMENTFSATILYDDKSQVSKLSYTLDYYYGSSVTEYDLVYDFIYDGDGVVRDFELESGAITGGVNFIYDEFDRLRTRTYDFWLQSNINNHFTNTVEYTFVTEEGSTSTQVQSYKTTINDDYTLTYTYTYDDHGNITKIQFSNGHQIRYVYDDLGQLLREDNTLLQKTFVYTYDFSGNLTSKRTYTLTAAGATPTDLQSSNTYSYNYAGWGDMLTAFNDRIITYDGVGNPRTYYNGQSWGFIWSNGRELSRAGTGSDILTFTYNDEGIRTSKTVNGVKHTYTLNGTQIVSEAWDNHLIIYIYDIDSMPIGMQYRNTSYAEGVFDIYWFERNLQGDILGVYNHNGTKLISYIYDAWGNVTTSYHNGGNASSARYNPFLYRGYYYDIEMKMYYLQSRYYDPAIGRFLNADSFISTNSGLLGSNMFAYCGNNPVMGYDPTGHFNWGKLFNGASLLAIGITACAAALTVVTAGACTPLLVAATVTFVAGGMTVLNGAAEVIESGTDYNFMRDGVMEGNEQLYEAQKEFFSTTAEIGTMIITAGSGSGKLCFAAGTVILLNEGRKAIEDIVVGDYVWAWDEETGEKSLRRVTETYVNQTSELVHVFVGGEEIVTTPTHPFYSPIKGWTDAAQLRAGDILVLVNGEYVVVEKVQHEILESPINVYNFQVAGDHTYYVTDIGVLVHNGCGNTPAAQKGKAMHKNWDYGQNGTTFRKEVTIPGVGRADAVDFANRIVYELKPNNTRAIRQGWRQLNKYVNALEETYGGTWIRILITYS